MFLNYFDSPITPQATLGPEFPVFRDYSSPFFPKSSSFWWTTTDLPTIEYSPWSDIFSSLKHMYELPKGSVTKLPKSPKCLYSSKGPPWCLLCGLKCGPAVAQPSVRSPNSWMWIPCLLFGLRPFTVQAILTGDNTAYWLNDTIPLTLELLG